MPQLPRRFRSVRHDAQPTQLAPSDTVPPDLMDVYDELPVDGDTPTDKPGVHRNPVVRQRKRSAPGLDRVSMRTYGPAAEDVSEALFGK